MTKQFPDSVNPARDLANLYPSRMNRGRDAYNVASEFLARHPESMRMRYAVARVSATTGEHLDEAERYLTAYLGYSPRHEETTHSHAHYRLGLVAQKHGDKTAARSHYETALELDSSNTIARDALSALR